MARYIREVKDYNGVLLSREESGEPFPRITQCGDWYQPGFERLMVRHVRQLQSRDGGEQTTYTILTVGPPFVMPASDDRLGYGSSRSGHVR